ncbi:MAG: NAD kinase [Crocinitomicaceae bacterium]|nr:NAD kinase [Crocinitomicaceae bacterium]|tara:strand:- start:495 stop:1376 length:882 start_codon:yes stop_codon:yes gene_type:complete
MEKIAIYGRSFGEQHINDVQILFDELQKRKIQISVYAPFYKYLEPLIKIGSEVQQFSTNKELQAETECLFSIGGDGTMLDSVTLVEKSNVPIFGINTGRLGFLSTIKMEDIVEALVQIDKGNYFFEERMLLELRTNPNLFGENNFGLNEVVVHKKDTSSMISIHAYINNEFLSTYWADGLIISTPTGSTAYSLSCGGPIITPGSENFVITPVAPHNLTSRPFVISSNDIIKLKVEGRGKDFLVSMDSRMETFDSALEIEIKKCDFSIRLLNLNNQTFLNTLSNKMNWGKDHRN